MQELTEEDLTLLIYLVRNRIRYESQRHKRMYQGKDVQNDKVYVLSDLRDKLEDMKLAL